MNGSAMKAIETHYNGYRFRSRLEARWAVFFDELRIKYQYEPEGFNLGDNVWYLPDFYLPEQECWLEIKPGLLDPVDQIKVDRFAKAVEDRNRSRKNADGEAFWHYYVLIGSPYPNEYEADARGFGIWRDITETFFQCISCGHIHIGPIWRQYNEAWHYQCGCCDWGECRANPVLSPLWDDFFHKGNMYVPIHLDPRQTLSLFDAYQAARSARFGT